VSRPTAESPIQNEHIPFQSRAGFSECLDRNEFRREPDLEQFQSRAGFSECLDLPHVSIDPFDNVFQSRAGFSECLDPGVRHGSGPIPPSFNPVLGFLSVSTTRSEPTKSQSSCFNPVLGFLSVSTLKQKVRLT